jgi:hypothetical protein
MGSKTSPRLGETVQRFEKPARSVNVVFLHCSAASRPDIDAHEINQWHLDRGWSGIGYHYFMTTDGTLQYGRDAEITPAAQSGYNTGSLAICLNGLHSHDFTEAQFARLRKFCDEINVAYGGIRFRGHREVAAKECPVFDYAAVLGLDANGMMVGSSPPALEPLPDDPVEMYEMTIARAQVSRSENNTHPNVRLAQGLLLSAGQDPGAVDGIAGSKFESAMLGFQKANGLLADGICGPNGWAGLESA